MGIRCDHCQASSANLYVDEDDYYVCIICSRKREPEQKKANPMLPPEVLARIKELEEDCRD